MAEINTYKVDVATKVEYRDDLSNPEQGQFVFYYHISISNLSNINVQLLSRHWIITDGNGNQQEVKGDGVVGEQPTLPASSVFTYTSSVVLTTPFGTMEGSYLFRAEDKHEFEAKIPMFRLAVPNILQ